MISIVPILFALGSMFCAAINDFIFKLYARKERPVGIYLSIIGAIWAGTFIITNISHSFEYTSGSTLGWGIISGVFSASANILLIRAMKKHEVGICATIYRLNLVPAVIVAFLFLGEHVTMWKMLGIIAAVISIFLFFQPGIRGKLDQKASQGFGLIITASLLRAGMGISYKCGMSDGGNPNLILSLNGLIWMISGLVYYFIVERKREKTKSNHTFRYGLTSGLLVCGIAFFMIMALKYGDASIVLPITQLSFIATAIIGIFFLGETLTFKKTASFTLAFLCIIFMSLN